MVVGNLAALRQTNVKRMLAYSSIAQAGYMLVGVAAWTGGGVLRRAVDRHQRGALLRAGLPLHEPRGLRDRDRGSSTRTALRSSRPSTASCSARPLLAVSFTVFFLSLLGIPPLAGFVGKFAVFGAAVITGNTGLAVDRRAHRRDLGRLLFPGPQADVFPSRRGVGRADPLGARRHLRGRRLPRDGLRDRHLRPALPRDGPAGGQRPPAPGGCVWRSTSAAPARRPTTCRRESNEVPEGPPSRGPSGVRMPRPFPAGTPAATLVASMRAPAGGRRWFSAGFALGSPRGARLRADAGSRPSPRLSRSEDSVWRSRPPRSRSPPRRRAT